MKTDDPTRAEVLSAAALDEADKMMRDDRLSEETKRRIARDLYPSLVLMARRALAS